MKNMLKKTKERKIFDKCLSNQMNSLVGSNNLADPMTCVKILLINFKSLLVFYTFKSLKEDFLEDFF